MDENGRVIHHGKQPLAQTSQDSLKKMLIQYIEKVLEQQEIQSFEFISFMENVHLPDCSPKNIDYFREISKITKEIKIKLLP